jgi:hypothetical protein
MRVLRGFGIALGVFLLVGGIGSMFTDQQKPSTADEKVAIAKRDEAERAETLRLQQLAAADQAKKELRFANALQIAKAIQTNMRDPESLVWESILTNEDASVACFSYRARNGFGGMNREFATFANGSLSQSASMWNKHCKGKSLYDMISVRWAL